MLSAVKPGSQMLQAFEKILFQRFQDAGGNQKSVNFSSGNPGFDPFVPAIEAARGAHSDHLIKIYGSDFGLRTEREALLPFCEGLKISPESEVLSARHIIPGMGVTFLFAALMETIGSRAAKEKPGQAPIILMTSPSYGLFAMQGEPFGMKVETVALRKENGWNIDPEVLDRRIKELNAMPGQFVAAFNHINPHNPMGTVEPPETTQAVARVLHANNVFGIDDLAYLGQEYERWAVPLAAYNFENSASLFSLSKTYGAPGLRSGFACAPADVIEDIARVVTRTIQCVPHSARAALVATYSTANDEQRRAYISANREGYQAKYQLVRAFVNGVHAIEDVGEQRRSYINRLFREIFGDHRIANRILENGMPGLEIVNEDIQSGYFAVLRIKDAKDYYYGEQRLDNSFKLSAAMIDQGRVLPLPMMCALAEEQLSDSVRVTFGISDRKIVRGLRGIAHVVNAMSESPDKELQKNINERGLAFGPEFES